MSSNPAANAQSCLPKPPDGSRPSAPKVNTPAAPEAGPVGLTATAGNSVIGNDLTILGKKITIISQKTLQVSGQIHGDVYGKQIVISNGGSVSDTVCAEKIEVFGGVHGSIQAATVTLHGSAKVNGDITHLSLSISESAEFEGGVRRGKDKNDLIPVLDAEAFAHQLANGGRSD